MELLDIVDEHGIPTGKTVERSLGEFYIEPLMYGL